MTAVISRQSLTAIAIVTGIAAAVTAVLLYKHQKAHLTMQADVAAIDKEIKLLQLKKLKENN